MMTWAIYLVIGVPVLIWIFQGVYRLNVGLFGEEQKESKDSLILDERSNLKRVAKDLGLPWPEESDLDIHLREIENSLKPKCQHGNTNLHAYRDDNGEIQACAPSKSDDSSSTSNPTGEKGIDVSPSRTPVFSRFDPSTTVVGDVVQLNDGTIVKITHTYKIAKLLGVHG